MRFVHLNLSYSFLPVDFRETSPAHFAASSNTGNLAARCKTSDLSEKIVVSIRTRPYNLVFPSLMAETREL